MDNPLVSIIVPIYNTPTDKLSICVRSLLKQTYENMEVLLIDDGSREETKLLVDEITRKDARLHAVHQKNGGASAARNRGLDLAEGKYLMFVDSDDCVNRSWLKYAVSLAEEKDADIVYGGIVMCDHVPESEPDPACAAYQLIEHEQLWQVQLALMHDEMSPIGLLDLGQCAKLFRRSCVSDVRFPLGVKLSEDQVFNHAVLHRCSKCAITDAQAYYYIDNPESVSHTYHPDAVEVMAKAMELIGPYVYDRYENRQAYAFRIIDDMLYAIQSAYFFDDTDKKTMREICSGLRNMKKEPIVAWAFQILDIGRIHNRNWKVKFYLLKYNSMLFVVFRAIYRKCKCVQGKLDS